MSNKLTPEETNELIKLLNKADPRTDLAGRYEVIITPTVYAPEDFLPRKKVCIGNVSNVVGEVTYTKIVAAPDDTFRRYVVSEEK